MSKKVYAVLFLVSIVILFIIFASLAFADDLEAHQQCAQIITSAYNPKNGECQNFSTPCEVPKKWVIGECPSLEQIENRPNCKKTCNQVFTNSTHNCSQVFRDSIHSCNQARKTSVEACQGLKGKVKRDCIKLALATSKLCKANANLAKKQCKLNAKLTRKTCVDACQLPIQLPQ